MSTLITTRMAPMVIPRVLPLAVGTAAANRLLTTAPQNNSRTQPRVRVVAGSFNLSMPDILPNGKPAARIGAMAPSERHTALIRLLALGYDI